MGSFSWYASDTKRAIRSDNYDPFPVYALRPDGDPLLETAYEGYGVFGGEDVYDLVADWNREYLSKHPGFLIPQHGRLWSEEQQAWFSSGPKRVDQFEWYPLYADLTKSREDVVRELARTGSWYWQWRSIGIDIACYDDQNAQLPFPIKLVEKPVPYAAAAASKSDPGQGWGCKDRYEGEEVGW